jgi:hypothetical protein
MDRHLGFCDQKGNPDHTWPSVPTPGVRLSVGPGLAPFLDSTGLRPYIHAGLPAQPQQLSLLLLTATPHVADVGYRLQMPSYPAPLPRAF